jgi:hypothetical protein
MCLAVGFYIYHLSIPLMLDVLPVNVIVGAFFLFLSYAVIWSVIRFFRQRVSKRTVLELYESLIRDDAFARARLCDTEVVERFVDLESRVGKLSSFQIVDQLTEGLKTSFVVQSVRNGLPRFEEVSTRSDGKRVVQLTALGI